MGFDFESESQPNCQRWLKGKFFIAVDIKTSLSIRSDGFPFSKGWYFEMDFNCMLLFLIMAGGFIYLVVGGILAVRREITGPSQMKKLFKQLVEEDGFQPADSPYMISVSQKLQKDGTHYKITLADFRVDKIEDSIAKEGDFRLYLTSAKVSSLTPERYGRNVETGKDYIIYLDIPLQLSVPGSRISIRPRGINLHRDDSLPREDFFTLFDIMELKSAEIRNMEEMFKKTDRIGIPLPEDAKNAIRQANTEKRSIVLSAISKDLKELLVNWRERYPFKGKTDSSLGAYQWVSITDEGISIAGTLTWDKYHIGEMAKLGEDLMNLAKKEFPPKPEEETLYKVDI